MRTATIAVAVLGMTGCKGCAGLPAPTRVTAKLSVASIKGELPDQCITVTTSMMERRDNDGALYWFTAEQEALYVAHDTLESNFDVGHALDSANIAKWMDFDKRITSSFANLRKQPKYADVPLESHPETKIDIGRQTVAQNNQTVWPLENWEKEITRGEVHKVPACDALGLVPLGRCVLSDSSDSFSWNVEQIYFAADDRDDSSAGPKFCAKNKGQWSAFDGGAGAR